MDTGISVIIPVYNAERTIRNCLDFIYQSDYKYFEVIVVDDHSTDGSIEIIKQFPCRCLSLPRHCGAAQARNIGAQQSTGNILFFTDADCLVQTNTLTKVMQALHIVANDTIVGGTYTTHPYDKNFFSRFQSIFIHFFETKNANQPDYIATHAMAMWSDVFFKQRGFSNTNYPILEDVEYCHALRRCGVNLRINPAIQVQHIFNFSLRRSIQNAVRKSFFWSMYTLQSGDLMTDSGTASRELKFNVLFYWLNIGLLSALLIMPNKWILAILFFNCVTNGSINHAFFQAIHQAYGTGFTFCAISYYCGLFPLAVSMGSLLGVSKYYFQRTIKKGLSYVYTH